MSNVPTLIFRVSMLALSIFVSRGSFGRAHPAIGPETNTHYHPSCNSYYSGSIGSHAFTMSLGKKDTLLDGAYAYSGHKQYLALKGNIGANGHFRMYEYDNPSLIGIRKRSTGTFEGTLSGDSLTGTWHGKRPGNLLPFHATQFVPDKRKALTAAIGEYRLIEAGGSVGANGMFGYSRENGKWTGGESSLSEGQRESESSSFSKEELHLLNSLKILVHPSLDLDLVVEKDTLLKIPFDPMGMHYLSHPHGGNATLSSDSVYESSRTFYEDKLALAFLDSADFSAVLGPLVENLAINVSDRMRLDYRPIQGEFIWSVGHNYFNYSELTFGRINARPIGTGR